MSIRTIKVDDLDETTEDGVDTVHFGLHGQEYAIDLSPANAQALESLLEDYVAAGTPVVHGNGGSHQPRRGLRRARSNSDTASTNDGTADIRSWAAANGYPVGDRGRIKKEIRDAYHASRTA